MMLRLNTSEGSRDKDRASVVQCESSRKDSKLERKASDGQRKDRSFSSDAPDGRLHDGSCAETLAHAEKKCDTPRRSSDGYSIHLHWHGCLPCGRQPPS